MQAELDVVKQELSSILKKFMDKERDAKPRDVKKISRKSRSSLIKLGKKCINESMTKRLSAGKND